VRFALLLQHAFLCRVHHAQLHMEAKQQQQHQQQAAAAAAASSSSTSSLQVIAAAAAHRSVAESS